MKDEIKENPPMPMKIGMDPMRTPILYADAIRITSNENGFVLDIAQGIAGSGQAMVVARIGLSKEHAQKLAEMVAEQVAKQGVIVTGKTKIIN